MRLVVGFGDRIGLFAAIDETRFKRIVVNNPMAFALIAAYLAMRILVFLLLKL